MAVYISYEDTTKLDINMEELIDVFEDAHKRIGLGNGLYDVAIAAYVYNKSREKGLGTSLPE